MRKSHRVTTVHYRSIAHVFLRAGMLSFGGWSTTALILEEDLVKKRRLLTTHDIKEATTFAQIIPGATQVAIVANMAYKLGGAKTALFAVGAYILPAASIVTIFAILYFNFGLSGVISGKFQGLIAALSGIILANAYKIGTKHAQRLADWLIPIVAMFALLVLHIHPLVLILVGGLAGVIFSISSNRRGTT